GAIRNLLHKAIQWGKRVFEPLPISQVWPLAKKCVIYNCNGRCILTVRNRISTNKSRTLHFITFITSFVFEHIAKHDLVLGGITLAGKHRRQTFLVVGHQVYTHLRRDFGPLLFADPLQILKVAFSLGGNEGMRFKPNIPRYMAPSIVPLMQWSRPVPLAEKQPRRITFLPPSLTVWMVFLGSYSAFFPLETRQVELMPKSLILASSDTIL